MLDILLPLISGVLIAIIAGIMGCFVVWKRMAYFGDSLAHSSLLGIALGVLYGFNTNIGVVVICSVFSILLLWFQHKKILATDTLLGILAHSGLAFGMIAVSFLNDDHFELHDYLFGDILNVTIKQIYFIVIGGLISLLLIIYNWESLIISTINQDLAKIEGVNNVWINFLIMALMTIIVSFSIKVIGILLITSLLIIPAASSRQISNSPESMAVISVILAVISVVLGLFIVDSYDVPSGPIIVSIATTLFVVIFLLCNILRFIKKN